MRLERSYYLVNELCHLGERWADRFSIQRPLTKQYLEGRFSVVFELEASVDGPLEKYTLTFEKYDGGRVVANDHGRSVCSENIDALEHAGLHNGRDQLVFVGYVKVMDCAQQVVPTLVRLELSEEIDDIWSGPMYCSIDDGSLKVFRTRREGEMNTRYSAPVITHDIASEEIKCSTQIVNGVSDQKRPIFWRSVTTDHAQLNQSRLAMEVFDHSVRLFQPVGVRLPVEVRNVFLGPLDF
jgi:hypothetical protein